MSLWQYTCVDTMKDSRDTSAPGSQLSAAVIAQGVNLCATLGVTHITCDVFFDYPSYMQLWVDAIRATGKSVWFRCHWNAWEGNNGVAATMTPAQYLTNTQAFITSNPLLFRSGDIFDACPEPDNSPYWVSTYGASYTNGAPNAATNAFNTFLLNLDSQLQSSFALIPLTGVNTKVRSLSAFWGKSIAALYPSTVAALGAVTVDSYPEGSSTDPTACANARLTELQQIASARPGVPIIIGEMGYSNAVSVTDAQQQAVIAAELAALATLPALIGANYWVAQGTDSSGGFTHLFGGTRGAWTLRPAAGTLANFYVAQRKGWLDASAQSVAINGVSVTAIPGSIGISNAIGQRSTARFSVLDTPGLLTFMQGQPVSIKSGGGNGTPNQALFNGVVMSAKRSNTGWSATMTHDIACADWHYLADKRIAATTYANQTCGFMVTDLYNTYLAGEGVTIQRGVNKFTAQQSAVESSDMSAFSPGASVTVSQDTTNQASGVGCLKVVTSGGANTFEQIEVHTPTIPFSPAQVITISAKIKASTGTPTLRWFVQSDSGAIGGTTTVTLSTTYQRITRTVTLPNPLTNVWIGLRFDTGTPAQAITFYLDEMQIEIGGAASAWELGGLQQSVQTGPTAPNFAVNYVPVSKALDDLANLAGYTWQIDANKVLWFVPPSAVSAPWVYDGTQAEDSSGGGGSTIEETNPLYRNGQWLLGIKDVTTSQTETRQGDGATRAYTMSYPLHSAPTVALNGVAQTVGIGQVDTGKQFYWNEGKNVVFQDPTGTALNTVYQTLIATGATAGTFTLTYKGVATANINWNDTAATVQTRLQALSTVGAGNALVTGGPLPGTSMLITFAAALTQDATQVAVGTNALTGGTPTLAAVPPLSVTYIGEWISNVYSQDAGAVAAELAIEGGGTGLVEEAHTDASITTSAQGFQLAAALLNRYAKAGRTLQFRTRSSGLAPQQLLSVNLPSSWGMTGVQALIESVDIAEDNQWWVYDISALIGPVNNNWVQYLQRLANPLGLDVGSAGSTQTVAISQPETAAWNWAATYTATVTTCPVFPLTFPVTFC